MKKEELNIKPTNKINGIGWLYLQDDSVDRGTRYIEGVFANEILQIGYDIHDVYYGHVLRFRLNYKDRSIYYSYIFQEKQKKIVPYWLESTKAGQLEVDEYIDSEYDICSLDFENRFPLNDRKKFERKV